ncbi:MAG: TetM/TetW/TetO/TetS family tetracycline resistance ribosomal protection protein [Acetatifactor sp.]|nr:TetM/TetW/TetO/TetS family tetracycline resistance ribosomal protection protein [Acetatifactor sp.]
MDKSAENKPEKHICLGILAHVDAGKTTLSEALLYTSGSLRKLGRVDHGDAFLDNFSLERARGITIFSKQAKVTWEGLSMTLLDTPGHVDFSAEMERTLQVLDYCILVISGSDGVQSHTATLWRLLEQYRIPTILFVNKMDQPDTDRGKLLAQLQARLDGSCMAFGPEAESDAVFAENLSLCSESLLEEYLETGDLKETSIAGAIRERHIFPCYFGSALRLEGVEELLDGLRRFTLMPNYPDQFGARVYKISRDAGGNRLTHLKVTGGVLRVKMPVNNSCSAASPEQVWEEKADQLRVYDGAQFSVVEQVEAGGICAVTGLGKTFVGQGLGAEPDSLMPILSPVLTYRLILPEGSDAVKVLGLLRQLEEEEPQLHLVWKEAVREIHVQVMGEVQIEILKSLIMERFGLEVEFGSGQIVYRETIAAPVVGIGHFEPLRHYAEVHLLLEPGEPGSGLQFATACSEDVLDRNWQRLVITHLEEKTHVGVLTGSAITDMKITLLAGRAHLKHTEGGDFRQATYRALRQGLMRSESVLLEPVFAFTLELPTEQLGRAMSDIQRMHGSFDTPVTEGERSILTGSAPASEFGSYQREVNAYTRGMGRLSCTLKGYEPCHNAQEVIEAVSYDPEGDLENPASSVFCAHGAGFLVGWDQVPYYAHVENKWRLEQGSDSLKPEGEAEHGVHDKGAHDESYSGGYGSASAGSAAAAPRTAASSQSRSSRSDYITQEEIEDIFQRTYKKGTRDYEPYRYNNRNLGVTVVAEENASKRSGEAAAETGSRTGGRTAGKARAQENQEEYLLVDGYNIIFAWEELRSLAAVNIDSARDKLMDICCDYQGYTGCTLILVYDAYKVKGNPGSVLQYHNIHVVYTREAETADQYIEKTVHKIGHKNRVTVATSDALEQMIIWGEGATRLSAVGFQEAVKAVRERFQESYSSQSRVYSKISADKFLD